MSGEDGLSQFGLAPRGSVGGRHGSSAHCVDGPGWRLVGQWPRFFHLLQHDFVPNPRAAYRRRSALRQRRHVPSDWTSVWSGEATKPVTATRDPVMFHSAPAALRFENLHATPFGNLSRPLKLTPLLVVGINDKHAVEWTIPPLTTFHKWRWLATCHRWPRNCLLNR